MQRTVPHEKRCQRFCKRICLLTSLVTILLGITCFIMLPFPSQEIEMASTDMKLVDTVSTVWCRGQEFVSTHPFTLYRVDDFPRIIDCSRQAETDKPIILLPRTSRYVRYYLLPGSTMKLETVANSSGGQVYILKGKDTLKECIEQQNNEISNIDDSGESDEESSEEERSFTDHRMKNPCGLAISSLDIPKGIINEPFRRNFADFKIQVKSADLYSILVLNKNTKDGINVRLRVTLNRTFYEVKQQDVVCSSQPHCVYHVNFGAHDKLVLYIPLEFDAGHEVFTVTTSCRPRVFFYALLFILIPIIFLVFLGGVMRAFSIFLHLPSSEGKYVRVRVNANASSLTNTRMTDVRSEEGAGASGAQRTPPPRYSDILGERQPSVHQPHLANGIVPTRYSLLQQQVASDANDMCLEETLPPPYSSLNPDKDQKPPAISP